MTAVEEITENVTVKFVTGLHEKGCEVDFIADALKLPIKKVEKIIQKIKSASN
jgi:CheY-specific phosphatase CheX